MLLEHIFLVRKEVLLLFLLVNLNLFILSYLQILKNNLKLFQRVLPQMILKILPQMFLKNSSKECFKMFPKLLIKMFLKIHLPVFLKIADKFIYMPLIFDIKVNLFIIILNISYFIFNLFSYYLIKKIFFCKKEIYNLQFYMRIILNHIIIDLFIVLLFFYFKDLLGKIMVRISIHQL
jgi:hypothetical protein